MNRKTGIAVGVAGLIAAGIAFGRRRERGGRDTQAGDSNRAAYSPGPRANAPPHRATVQAGEDQLSSVLAH
jgi:hypothetical protein